LGFVEDMTENILVLFFGSQCRYDTFWSGMDWPFHVVTPTAWDSQQSWEHVLVSGKDT